MCAVKEFCPVDKTLVKIPTMEPQWTELCGVSTMTWGPLWEFRESGSWGHTGTVSSTVPQIASVVTQYSPPSVTMYWYLGRRSPVFVLVASALGVILTPSQKPHKCDDWQKPHKCDAAWVGGRLLLQTFGDASGLTRCSWPLGKRPRPPLCTYCFTHYASVTRCYQQ